MMSRGVRQSLRPSHVVVRHDDRFPVVAWWGQKAWNGRVCPIAEGAGATGSIPLLFIFPFLTHTEPRGSFNLTQSLSFGNVAHCSRNVK